MMRLMLNLCLFATAGAIRLSDETVGGPLGVLAEKSSRAVVPEMYHTHDAIIAELNEMASSCPHMKMSQLKRGNMTINIAHFKKDDGRKKMKVLVYFGEHARELVSPESALNLAGHLCYRYENTKNKAESLLNHAEIRMVPVVNPDGHNMVMKSGNLCHRTNGRGVDLNRNWDDHWESTGSLNMQTFGGEKPFSETETQLLKEDATEYKPNVFLTVHSGTLGLFTPWAYKSMKNKDPTSLIENPNKYPSLISMENRYSGAETRVKEMLGLLQDINPKYCNCEAGAAGDVLPYLSPGTSLDFIFDKLQADYAFAFEIWDGRSKGGYKYASSDVSLLERGTRKRHSCFLDDGEEVEDQSDELCFAMFNPSTETKYKMAMDNWSNAYLDLFSGLIDIEKKHGAIFLQVE
mmetsp:Transcript_3308/g.7747  ORF Transcript_3308/g.7747 Transcript_3308/m.7747 type:complete len:406 (+) Transcript_3308:53-1270(+)